MFKQSEEFEHYSQISFADFKKRWPSFSPEEIACNRTGKVVLDTDALDKLQRLRNALGVPVIVTSGTRSKEHNKAVGGEENSAHLKGAAFDVSMSNHDPAVFIAAARKAGFTGIGTYPEAHRNFVHVDTGAHLPQPHKSRARSWGKPFPERASRFAPEPEARGLTETREGVAIVRGLAATGLTALASQADELAALAQSPVASMLAEIAPWVIGGLAGLAVLALLVRALRRGSEEKLKD